VKAAGAQRRVVAAQPRPVAAVVAANPDRQRAVLLPTADIPTAPSAVPVAPADAVGDDVVAGAAAFAGVSGVQDRFGVRGRAVADLKVGVAGQAIADLKVGVAVALDRLGDWLSALPANPISDFLSGALLVVRRTLLPDVPTIPRVVVTNSTVLEGGDVGATTDAVFTVTLDKAYDTPITVAYSTDDDAWKDSFVLQQVIDQITDAVTGVGPGYVAISGQDYVPATGLLSFAPGQTSQQVSVSVLGDKIDEPTETFSLNVFPTKNSRILLAAGTGKIRSDTCTKCWYSITNLSAKSVELFDIQTSPGYEDLVVTPPVGTILKPGETLRFDLNTRFFYYYTTYLVFQGCNDISCDLFRSDQRWIVGFEEIDGALKWGTTRCLGTGWCSTREGYDPDPGAGWQFHMNLLDKKAPCRQNRCHQW
jgi:hypothetical protein